MRIGGPLFETITDPAALVEAHRRHGYSAAYFPEVQDEVLQKEMALALLEADIILAERGAYGINLLDLDFSLRQQNIDAICRRLALADECGVLCCVMHCGTVQAGGWGAANPENISSRSFDANVRMIQQIIDAVGPRRTKLVFEMASWTLPDGPEVYLRMLQAIDRLQAGAHLDPLNILSSPRACYENGAILRTCFRLLGQRIVSCHSKDILLKNVYLPLEITETYTGAGVLDYDVYLAELAKLPHEPPLMIEHLEAHQLPLAIRFLHNKAKALGIPLRAAHHLDQ